MVAALFFLKIENDHHMHLYDIIVSTSSAQHLHNIPRSVSSPFSRRRRRHFLGKSNGHVRPSNGISLGFVHISLLCKQPYRHNEYDGSDTANDGSHALIAGGAIDHGRDGKAFNVMFAVWSFKARRTLATNVSRVGNNTNGG